MPGPLSPGYAAQVPYNYNQLEGRFKQLQGKPVRVFWRCCHAMILVNMLVRAFSQCTKVSVREDKSGSVGSKRLKDMLWLFSLRGCPEPYTGLRYVSSLTTALQ